MDSQHLSRLQEEQSRAISDTDAQISQIEKFKSDYKALQERLKSLPDQLTHDVMVPFGKFAFMPGKLVHTNEILVLLGNNWFAERTAKQAHDIAGRRIGELNKQLNSLTAQRKLLEPRLEFTSDLQGHVEGQKNVKEIVEEYDAEKERLWDEQHRKNVRRQRAEERAAMAKADAQERTKDRGKKQQDEDQDADLWARLDALEREEAERGEMDSLSGEESEEERIDSTSSHEPQRKRISWQGETTNTSEPRELAEDVSGSGEGAGDLDSDDAEGSSEDEDVSDNDVDDEDNNGSENDGDDDDDDDGDTQPKRPVVRTIRFTHTSNPSSQVKSINSSGDASIDSPADIYKLFSPASILKKSEPSQRDNSSGCRENQSASSALATKKRGITFGTCDTSEGPRVREERSQPAGPPVSTSSSLKAFSGRVMEVPVHNTPRGLEGAGDGISGTAPSAAASTDDQPAIRISKFKASRLEGAGEGTSSTAPSAAATKDDQPPKRMSKFKASRMAQQGPS